MWGDHEKARRLEAGDTLATLIFQICGPAHIAYSDPRWQEVLHGYNVWIHIDNANLVVEQACQSLRQHASRSSNLAALMLHCTRLVRELCQILDEQNSSSSSSSESKTDPAAGNTASSNGETAAAASSVTAFSNRIALVTQARTVAGMLTLLRILLHDAIIMVQSNTHPLLLGDVLVYQNRDTGRADETAGPLLDACLQLITSVAEPSLHNVNPDLYDAMAANLQLLVVLFSDQLYAPAMSSFQRQQQQVPSRGPFWELLMRPKQSSNNDENNNGTSLQQQQQQQAVVAKLLEWHVQRPLAPERSIALHQYHVAQTLAHSKQHAPDSDGLYTVHQVVAAATRRPVEENGNGGDPNASAKRQQQHHNNKNAILDATKGVLVLSSNIIMLPFRLVSLALHLFGNKDNRNNAQLDQYNAVAHACRSQRVKHVLWVSDSPVADLGNSLLLLWMHNNRAETAQEGTNNSNSNGIRGVVGQLTDNRFNDLPDLPSLTSPIASGSNSVESDGLTEALLRPPPPPSAQLQHCTGISPSGALTINFELLFEAFGRIAHTEPGALLLYTVLQACPAFSEFLAVRSDIDAIVLPLLRTLYMASSLRHYAQSDYQQNGGGERSNRKQQIILNCPFRSQSQLYVIVILLLLFSQDAAFGSDVFRRVTIASLPWYKERKLQEIRLGSVVILVLLRLLTFNANRLQDAFLLSNACAVLENLAPAVVDLHEYSAMRLSAVSLSSLQRFLTLRQQNPDVDLDGDDLTIPVTMHAEVSRTLLHILHCALGPKNVGQNLYLVYALIYQQTDWKAVVEKDCSEVGSTNRIEKVLKKANAILQEHGNDSRTASKAMAILQQHKDGLMEAVGERGRRKEEDFTFTYEEEADPEVFFVPYVWEVIVSAVTSGTMDWNQDAIQVFALLDKVEPIETNDNSGDSAPPVYSEDVSDVV